MASAVTSQKLFANNALVTYDHDPGTASALITSPDGGTTKRYLPIALYENFAGLVMTTVSASSSGATLVDLVAASDSAGTDVTTVVSSGTVAADAVGDFVAVECTAAQIKEVGDAAGKVFTHFGVRITCSNSGDECAVTYWRGGPKFATKDLTANAIS
jgi:hypothetical protein